MADSEPAPRKNPRKLSDYGHPAPADATRSLFASPFGLGKAVWGSLDHSGYTMSNQSHFYGNFILEVASNIHNDQKRRMVDLKELTGKHPRMDANSYNYFAYWGINQARNFNVMYSQAANGRGNMSHRETLVLDDNWETFSEAHAYAEVGSDVRAWYVAFPLPGKGEKHIWIDMNWPLRSIYLPISHRAQPGEQNLATYAQINFRHANGRIAVRKFREDGAATEWFDFAGDNKLGLYRPGQVMRVNLEHLFHALVLPDSSRAESPLVALELHNWDAVNCRWGDSWTSQRDRRVREIGKSVADYFSANGGVDLSYDELPENFLKGLLQSLISAALSFIPAIGPVLAVASDLAFDIIDHAGDDMSEFLNAEFGVNLAMALLDSSMQVKKMKKKKKWEKAGGADELESGGALQYPLLGMDDPEAVRWTTPSEEPSAKELAEPSLEGKPRP